VRLGGEAARHGTFERCCVQEIAALFDPKVHKKRARREGGAYDLIAAKMRGLSYAASAELNASAAAKAAAGGVIVDSAEALSYEDMLDRVHDQMRALNPSLVTRTVKKLRPPNVVRLGTTRSCWQNFVEIAESLKRDSTQLKEYFLAELGTTGQMDDKGQLVLKGRHSPASVENLLRKYIGAYVMCSNCRSIDTVLEKNTATRLMTMRCLACASTRTVAAVRTGFKIVKKGQRRKERAAAQS
jgi:translation initiation factor 2 subunit 2